MNEATMQYEPAQRAGVGGLRERQAAQEHQKHQEHHHEARAAQRAVSSLRGCVAFGGQIVGGTVLAHHLQRWQEPCLLKRDMS
jgi:hypothetical protein